MKKQAMCCIFTARRWGEWGEDKKKRKNFSLLYT